MTSQNSSLRSYSEQPLQMKCLERGRNGLTHSQRRSNAHTQESKLRPDSGCWPREGPATRHTVATKIVFWGGRKNRKGERDLSRTSGKTLCFLRKCAPMKRQEEIQLAAQDGQANSGTVVLLEARRVPSPGTTCRDLGSSPACSPSSIAKEEKNCAKTTSCQITKPLPLLQELVTYLLHRSTSQVKEQLL